MNIKKRLKKYGLRPNTNAGQHFLLDESILESIVETAGLSREETVLEIGPGPGNLTVFLAQAAGRVIAVESDSNIIRVLEESTEEFSNVEIVNQDVFQWRRQASDIGDYKIVANLPYYITSKILREFISQSPKPKSLTLLVQDEVADRITARPGQMSLLSLSIQYYAEAHKVATVPRTAFWPKPEVNSAIIMIENLKENKPEDKDFFQTARVGFSSRRKQLQNNIKSGFRLSTKDVLDVFEKVGINPTARPQELTILEWDKLSSLLKKLIK